MGNNFLVEEFGEMYGGLEFGEMNNIRHYNTKSCRLSKNFDDCTFLRKYWLHRNDLRILHLLRQVLLVVRTLLIVCKVVRISSIVCRNEFVNRLTSGMVPGTSPIVVLVSIGIGSLSIKPSD